MIEPDVAADWLTAKTQFDPGRADVDEVEAVRRQMGARTINVLVNPDSRRLLVQVFKRDALGDDGEYLADDVTFYELSGGIFKRLWRAADASTTLPN